MFTKIKRALLFNRALNQYQSIYKEVQEVPQIKSLFASKVFWTNICMLGLTVGQILPPKFGVPAVTIINILLRMVTDTGVSVIGPFTAK